MDEITKMKNLERDKIVQTFSKKWEYRYDTEQYGQKDAWFIIKELSPKGKYVGDCEDFALTLLYKLADESIVKFWWLLITRQAKICAVGPSRWKSTHAVLRYKGMYADNWTKRFVVKKGIEDNGFVFSIWLFIPVQVAIKMAISEVYKFIRSKR